MLARPRLKIRYGKYGNVISPASTIGYVGQFLFVSTLVGFIVTSVLRRGRSAEWVLAVPIGSFLLFLATRDLVAWAIASAAERDAFREGVERARLEREHQRRASRPMTGRECVGYVALLSVTFGYFGVVLVGVATRNPAGDNSSAAFLAAALVSAWLGGSLAIIRRYRRGRGGLVRPW